MSYKGYIDVIKDMYDGYKDYDLITICEDEWIPNYSRITPGVYGLLWALIFLP